MWSYQDTGNSLDSSIRSLRIQPKCLSSSGLADHRLQVRVEAAEEGGMEEEVP